MPLTLVCLGLAALLSFTCRTASLEAQLLQADAPSLTSPGATEAQVTQLIAASNALADNLYYALATDGSSNLVYSPYSIALVFSMLYAGAQREAEAQMAEVLHLLPQAVQHPALNTVDQQLQSMGKGTQHEDEGTAFQLSLANAVWGQRGYPLKESYLETLATQYSADLRVVDFQGASEKAREAINFSGRVLNPDVG